MVNGIRTGDHGSKFCVGSQIRQTPEEDRRIYRPKCCKYNNKDKDNCQKTLNDKKAVVLFNGGIITTVE